MCSSLRSMQKVKGLISFFHPALFLPFKTVIITTKLSAQGDAGQPGLPGTLGSAGKSVYGASATRVYPPPTPSGSRLF